MLPMKSPPHPGRLIKDEIDALGLSVAQAAEGLGATRQQLYRVINGESPFRPEWPSRNLSQGKSQKTYDCSGNYSTALSALTIAV